MLELTDTLFLKGHNTKSKFLSGIGESYIINRDSGIHVYILFLIRVLQNAKFLKLFNTM